MTFSDIAKEINKAHNKLNEQTEPSDTQPEIQTTNHKPQRIQPKALQIQALKTAEKLAKLHANPHSNPSDYLETHITNLIEYAIGEEQTT